MAAEKQSFDAVIVGAGPAGVTCAVWMARLGFKPALVDAAAGVGGLCRFNPYVDDWNPSLPGATGEQLADNLALSLGEAGVTPWLSRTVTEARVAPVGVSVVLAHGPSTVMGRFLVLATGVRPRSLPGLNGPLPAVLVGPGRHILAQDFRGLRVAVLGGGDNAFGAALYAMERGAARVRVYARNVRAQRQLVAQVPAQQVVRGDYVVDPHRRRVDAEAFDLIMVFYGWEPCIGFARALGLRCCARGFIETDPATAQTSTRGVYAIGEVTRRQHPCVVTAMADGITAAKAMQARIEAGR
ncbi:MAG: NAD(P)/FAD-dependent oxidoreductase [Candidimonas sp.]|nr:MAG: NAD(P)/FAD-dependent oxidoreductase [Candidimonas sp.]